MSPSTSINIHRVTQIETRRNTRRDSHWVSFFFRDEDGNVTEVTAFCSNELAEAASAAFPAYIEDPVL